MSAKLDDIANECGKIALDIHRHSIYTFAGFIALLTEQLGQVSQRYWHETTRSKENSQKPNPDLATDICDVIVQCVCALNWLGFNNYDINIALNRSLEKLRKAVGTHIEQK
jgi:hypothetical protein